MVDIFFNISFNLHCILYHRAPDKMHTITAYIISQPFFKSYEMIPTSGQTYVEIVKEIGIIEIRKMHLNKIYIVCSKIKEKPSIVIYFLNS